MVAFVFFAIGAPLAVFAAGEKIVSRVAGTLEDQRGGKGAWERIIVSRELSNGDVARTQAKSEGKILLEEDKDIRIYEKTTVEMSKLDYLEKTKTTILKQVAGRMKVRVLGKKVGVEERINVMTPSATMAARGTFFQSTVFDDGSTLLDVYDHSVLFEAGGKKLLVGAGNSAYVLPGQPPAFISPYQSIVVDSQGVGHMRQDSAQPAPGVRSSALVNPYQYGTLQYGAVSNGYTPAQAGFSTWGSSGVFPESFQGKYPDGQPISGSGSQSSPSSLDSQGAQVK